MEKQPCQAWMQEPRLQFHARLRPSSKILDIGPSGFSAEGIDWTIFPTGGKKRRQETEDANDFPSTGEYAGRVMALEDDPDQLVLGWIYADEDPLPTRPPGEPALSLPYLAATFDGVWMNSLNLRLTVGEEISGLAEVRRVLKDDGVLYCYAPGSALGCMVSRSDNFAERLPGKGLARLLRDTGFSIRSGRVQEFTMSGAIGGIRHGYSVLAVAV